MIDRFSITATGNLIFGNQSLDNLSLYLTQMGYSRIAMIISRTVSESPAYRTLIKNLTVAVHTYPVSGEPTVDSIDAVTQQCVADGCDVVVGIGGGSALDSAKAVAVMAQYVRKQGITVSVKEFLEGVGTLAPPAQRLPLIAIPTTAGTGSEATKNAVIAHIGPDGFKKSLRHDAYIPDLVIIDPLLAVTAPFHVTAAAGLDALTQLLEAYVSTQSNPFIDSLALYAIGLAGNALNGLLQGGLGNSTLRADMAYAAYISGMAIANAGLGYVHGFAGPLGALHSAPHGMICGKLIGPIHAALIAEAQKGSEDNSLLQKFQAIAPLWGKQNPQEVVEHIQHLVALANLPNLRDFGYTKDELRTIGAKQLERNSPIILARETTISILEELY